MSQILSSGTGGGGGGITTIQGDTGSVTGATVSITGLTTAGASVSFDGSGTAMTFNVTDANRNTIIGNQAAGGGGSASDTDNTILGYQTGYYIGSSAQNILIGSQTGVEFARNAGCTRNVIMGYQAGYYTDHGSNDNTLIGNGAGTNLGRTSAASFNTAIGSSAMGNGQTTSSRNTCIGYTSGQQITSGEYNTAVGAESLNNITTGAYNTGIGESALFNCNADNNAMVGINSGWAITSGANNTGIGYFTYYGGGGVGLVSGNNNTAVGSSAGSAYTGGESNNILIGANVVGVVGENNTQRLGDTATITNTYIAGAVNKPNTPAFNSYVSAAQNGVTGDNTTYTIIFDSERFDQSSSYDTGTGIFTAPVAGRYMFSVAVFSDGLDGTNTNYTLRLTTSNDTFLLAFGNFVPVAASTDFGITGSALCDMDAGDTAFVQITVGGASLNVNIQGSATVNGWQASYFSGYLVA